jgi:hypothetical protein
VATEKVDHAASAVQLGAEKKRLQKKVDLFIEKHEAVHAWKKQATTATAKLAAVERNNVFLNSR